MATIIETTFKEFISIKHNNYEECFPKEHQTNGDEIIHLIIDGEQQWSGDPDSMELYLHRLETLKICLMPPLRPKKVQSQKNCVNPAQNEAMPAVNKPA